MRVRRRRRRMLGAALVLVYLAASAWLLSPLWRSADAAPAKLPVRTVRAGGLVGLSTLGAAKPLPVSLPNVSPTTRETGVTEVTGEGEGEVEAPVSSPEAAETPVSTPSSNEPSSSSSSQTIIGGEG